MLTILLSTEAKALRGHSLKSWMGVCDPLAKTLTLFMTEICDICYPFYDVAKNSIPYLWSLQLVAINICYEGGEGFIDNDERVASSKAHTLFKTRPLKPYLI